MEGVRVSRRSLNSVSQDLAPLMTIEDDDVDEGVILIRPANAPTSSPPELNESSVVLSKSSSVKKAVSRGSTCLRWTLGALLILSGVALNVSIPIYTVGLCYGAINLVFDTQMNTRCVSVLWLSWYDYSILCIYLPVSNRSSCRRKVTFSSWISTCASGPALFSWRSG